MGKRKLIPRRVLFGNPDRAMVCLSPGGKWISYLAPAEGVLNVWVAPAGAPERAKPVTHDRGRGIRHYTWAHTDRHVLYLQDADGDENWRAYSVDVETEEARDLTPQSGVQARLEGVSPRFPSQVLISLNDRDAHLHDLYRVNIQTGEKTLVQENEGFLGFMADDDYQVRFALRFCPDGGAELLAKEGEGWRPFIQVSPEDSLGTQPVGLDAAGQVLYMIDSRSRDTAAVTAIDLHTGEQRILAEDSQADACGAIVHPVSKHLQAVSFTYQRRRWEVVDPEVATDLQRLAEAAPGDMTVVSRTLADDRWIVAYDLDRGPVRYYLYERQAGQVHFLFSSRAELEDYELAAMHPVIIRARDGLDLVSYLTLPADSDPAGTGRPAEPCAMVLVVHGGPWSRDTWGLNPFHQWLANRGYAVLSVNFRGSTGFGKRFVNAGDREWAGAMHDDLVDAVEWAVAKGIADPARVAIMGGSYGGYATLVGLTFTPELFACGVDMVGPSNLITLLRNVPPYWAPMFPMLARRVGDPDLEEDQAFLRQRSPLTHVERIRRPLLIGQGANDPRVRQVESDQIVEAMRAHGIPVTYVLYPDEGHGFVRPENRLSFFAIAESFLAQFLGGEAEPAADDLQGASLQVLTGVEHVPGLAEALPG
ncbi:MAG: alpha/beta fold hydrolase [Candidatus Bipolaricaulaceae bacterium]